jgi:sigma-54 dependent transcriptional regulator, acetoin dehydrogenase operon transcriptional activator AcoR
LIAQLVGPGLHLVDTGPIGIDIGNSLGWASLNASRVAAAQVAFLHLTGFLHIVHGAKRASDSADLATYAGRIVNHFGPSGFVHRNSLNRTSMQAPSLVALGAGVGYLFASMVKIKHLDARLARRIVPIIFKRTRHFALQASGAFVRINVQHLLHKSLLWVCALRMQSCAYVNCSLNCWATGQNSTSGKPLCAVQHFINSQIDTKLTANMYSMPPLAAPSSAPSRLDLISQSRRVLLGGQRGRVAVHDWIAQSWQRCLEAGREPHQRLAFDMVSNVQQRRSREANRQLAQAAQPTLLQLGAAIAPIRYFAVLTNAQGVVVASSGQIDAQDRRATLISREGVDLSEHAVGTTAISAALAEKTDVWLHRGEHFFEDTGAYSCAGSPIFDGTGRCAGMLDVTGIDVPERPELMHMVSSAARRIGNQLVLAAPHTLVVHMRWPGAGALGREAEGLLCLDEDGLICAMNGTARQMLGLTASASDQHASDLFATDWRKLFDTQLGRAGIQVPLWTGLQVELRTSRTGQLTPKSAPAAAADTRRLQKVGALKAHEVDVIRDTVTQLRGNVAAAASSLGISRATVYRKLRS